MPGTGRRTDALADGIRFGFFCGDEVYGNCTELRSFLEGRGQAEDFELGKDCFGLDESQVRLYTAIACHTVLAMAALAICAVTAALLRDRTSTQAPPPVIPGQPPPPDPGMIPLTVPEIRRLLAARLATPSPPGHPEHWLGWRLRRQARARWYHQRTRLARDTEIAQVS